MLERADVVVYDGLVGAGILELSSQRAELIYAGKKRSGECAPRSQAEINALLVAEARAGKQVVRLKGGDPFVFGRAGEELEVLSDAGIDFEVVPGISAATAVTAYAGIPLTMRGVSSSVVFATGHEAAGKPDSDVEWQAVARVQTIVLFMACQTLSECVSRLIGAGRSADTPAAAIYWGTTARQRTVVASLGTLSERVSAEGLRPPLLVVIGEVVAHRDKFSWYEKRPLFGKRVVVTRDPSRARDLAHRLTERGAEVLAMPVTRLSPACDDAEVTTRLSELRDYDWVVFTSANAVERFFDELRNRDLDARQLAGARLACVGPVTAAALRACGLRADIVPGERRDALGVAQAILSQQSAPGMRVLLPRARAGREQAVDTLRAAGAVVDVLPIYHTEVISSADSTLVRSIQQLRRRLVDVLAVFAPSQVRALEQILGAGEAATLVNQCRCVVAIGRTTQSVLLAAGMRVDMVPSSPDVDTFTRELMQIFSQEA